jgi:hypothetical protein
MREQHNYEPVDCVNDAAFAALAMRGSFHHHLRSVDSAEYKL